MPQEDNHKIFLEREGLGFAVDEAKH